MSKKPTLKEALKQTGFGVCSFKFEDGEQCDKCEKVKRKGANVYYRGTDYWSEEGEYFCRDCVVSEAVYLSGRITKPCRSCANDVAVHCPSENPICYDCYSHSIPQEGH